MHQIAGWDNSGVSAFETMGRGTPVLRSYDLHRILACPTAARDRRSLGMSAERRARKRKRVTGLEPVTLCLGNKRSGVFRHLPKLAKLQKPAIYATFRLTALNRDCGTFTVRLAPA